ncbi:uncharacterized mitochondrial protein AtMg00810-like [Solanum dulcamara]|uniref:uncharacterized mitochondrial protein AtMg00810-like n=1 Tax=Solanum dulcamara TaxID=45834 RepID=UPI002485D46B|nr:uncharacterized mitochondrial protein AtMg00810-like [Solanum dulcamara]
MGENIAKTMVVVEAAKELPAVEDFQKRRLVMRCNSWGEIYPITNPVTSPSTFSSLAPSLWHKSLYGLKQALRAWYNQFAGYIHTLGFLTVRPIILCLFIVKDLVPLSYFLGIAVTHHTGGLFLSQRKYAAEIIDRAGISSCKPSTTPKAKAGAIMSIPFEDPSLYQSLVEALQYLTFTRPDITYVVQQVCLFMHDPRDEHMNALKRIVRYLQGTFDYGLHLYPSSTTTLVSYSDADWGGYPNTKHSTSGYCVFMDDNLISWSAKCESTLSHLSAEAEYRGVANVVSEHVGCETLSFETSLSNSTGYFGLL